MNAGIVKETVEPAGTLVGIALDTVTAAPSTKTQGAAKLTLPLPTFWT